MVRLIDKLRRKTNFKLSFIVVLLDTNIFIYSNFYI